MSGHALKLFVWTVRKTGGLGKLLGKLWNSLLPYFPVATCCDSLHRGMRHIDEEQSKVTTHLCVLVDTTSRTEYNKIAKK